MGLHQIEHLSAYLERLRGDPKEASALARDLTINVSGFFRDPQAWKILDEQVIAPLVRERDTNSAIRIWVPGCATGEEAYSLSMLIAERAQGARKAFDVRIFATDVSDHLLPMARAGLYPASIAPDVDVGRLERFFDVEEDSYQAKKGLRDTITFAPQNLLQDPPFSRLDLISCRNVLIYLETDVQRKLLALFHFTLREHGHLFLGPAESISGQEGLFHPVSKKWRIYRRLGPTRHDIVDFPLVGAGEVAADAGRPHDPPPHERRGQTVNSFQRTLLERYAPASVLIDRHFGVHAFHGQTGDYLQQPGGEPSANLLALARDGLHAPLRRAVQTAIAENEEVSAAGRLRRDGSFRPIRLVVSPLKRGRGAEGMLAVSFFERETPEASGAGEVEETAAGGDLEAELFSTREDLRLTIEQMEAANEELKASNEEIRSINEELQASNEELETSKEELQSLNEELNTTNAQLQSKLEELEVRTDDLNNLLNSSDVATLFLDLDLRIRWFTPTMKGLLELLPTDVGRPVAHFAQKFTGDLVEDASRVLAKLSPEDAEVLGAEDRWYLRHIVPYRTRDNRISGVVATFTEITDRKRREREVEEAKEFAEAIVEAVRFPLLVLTPELRVKSANPAFYGMFQVSPDVTEGRPLSELGNRQWNIPELHQLLTRILPEDSEFADFEIDHEFEGIGRRTMLLHARPLDGSRLILLGMADLTERKRGEQERELLSRELSHRVKNILAVVQSLAVQTDHSRSIEEFRETFIGRLAALARAHSLVLDADWRGADLKWLVEQALQAYRVDHPKVVEIEGESVPLSPTQGLGLSLVLHELGTNAAKYGALSRSDGCLTVSWRVEDGDRGRRLRLLWQEAGGPPVEPPAEKSFGTRLIERACTYELEGDVELNYAPDGLRCEVIFPVA
jgi:two-component system CheB/CheR fusion protein